MNLLPWRKQTRTESEGKPERSTTLATLTIAAGAGVASMSMNFWIPFLPLYMLRLGATDDANALFWIGLATSGQGLARLFGAPFWGMLSDRFGRKLMYLRALYFATGTTLIAAFATEPWQIVVAFTCQGLLSGFVPASVALTSVTVPDRELTKSIGIVAGAQYLGSTVGPAIGAGLAIVFGLRGSIFVAALMPAAAATMALFVVRGDSVEKRRSISTATVALEQEKTGSILSAQFFLAIFFYFFLFAVTQLVRLSTPASLTDLTGHESKGLVGIAFTLGGLGSLIGILMVARRWVIEGTFARMLALGCVAAGAAHLLLAAAPNAALYVLWFTVISLAEASMLPAANTLIAANVPRAKRGTAFGFAGSAQALAFMVGPMSAALFVSISLALGYAVLGVLFLALALLVRTALREPARSEDPTSQVTEPAYTNVKKGTLAIGP